MISAAASLLYLTKRAATAAAPGDLSRLQAGQLATLLRQQHNALKAGPHTDFRIGTPQTGLYSWAIPRDLPQAVGQKRLAIQQNVHRYGYKDFQGQIGPGYGAGTVQKKEQTPVVILQSSPTVVRFTRANTRNAPVYTMVRTKGDRWLTTIQRQDIPTEIRSYNKEHFKDVDLKGAADIIDNDTQITPKIDGAGALALIRDKDIDVYGIRSDKSGNPIRYTDHIGGLRSVKPPKELVGQIFRGQVGGTLKGKPIPPQELSGLLNSNLQTNIKNRKNKEAILKLYLLSELAKGKETYNQPQMQEAANKLNTQAIESLPIYTKDHVPEQVALMQHGTHPLTQQGLVLVNPGQRPIKAKLKQDYDVTVRDIFPAQTKTGPRAGGFHYSLPGSGKIVGKVGTGFTHGMLRDMLGNPDKYIGQTARIQSQGQYDTGAYRAPAFVAFKQS